MVTIAPEKVGERSTDCEEGGEVSIGGITK
jgi:hypothetical protein